MQVVWGTKNKASQWKIALRRLQLRIFHSDVAVAQVFVGVWKIVLLLSGWPEEGAEMPDPFPSWTPLAARLFMALSTMNAFAFDAIRCGMRSHPFGTPPPHPRRLQR